MKLDQLKSENEVLLCQNQDTITHKILQVESKLHQKEQECKSLEFTVDSQANKL